MLVQEGQLYWPFPFSKNSLPWVMWKHIVTRIFLLRHSRHGIIAEGEGTVDLLVLASSDRLLIMLKPGKPYQRGRISTVDLLVLTSLDQLLFILKLNFSIFTKQPIIVRVTSTVPSPSVWVPCWNYTFLFLQYTCTVTSPSLRDLCSKGQDKHRMLLSGIFRMALPKILSV